MIENTLTSLPDSWMACWAPAAAKALSSIRKSTSAFVAKWGHVPVLETHRQRVFVQWRRQVSSSQSDP
jgi:hypothetical protein